MTSRTTVERTSDRELVVTRTLDAPARLVEAHSDAAKLAALDARHLRALDATAGRTPIVRVPELETDVHDIKLLARLADVLTGASPPREG